MDLSLCINQGINQDLCYWTEKIPCYKWRPVLASVFGVKILGLELVVLQKGQVFQAVLVHLSFLFVLFCPFQVCMGSLLCLHVSLRLQEIKK